MQENQQQCKFEHIKIMKFQISLLWNENITDPLAYPHLQQFNEKKEK